MFHSPGPGTGARRGLGPPKLVWLLAIVSLAVVPRLALAADGQPGWQPKLQGNFDVRQLIEAGGIVGILLCAMSIATFALTLEHLVSLRRNAVNPRKLAEQAHQLMQQRQFQIAARLCRDDGSLLGFVLAAGLTEVGNGYAVIEKAMEDACAQYSARLYRKIDTLSVIGTLSPMIGLVGTVWGMMIAFSEFASKANVQVTELAPGISTALVTTLLGLVVAVPAYAAFAYFRNRVDEGVTTCSQLVDHLFLDYRRAQAQRRKKLRAAQLERERRGVDYLRPAFPSVAIEREKSA